MQSITGVIVFRKTVLLVHTIDNYTSIQYRRTTLPIKIQNQNRKMHIDAS